MASLPFCELAAELAAELVMLVTWFVVNSRKNIVEVSSRAFSGVQLCHERHPVFSRVNKAHGSLVHWLTLNMSA